ncbi:MAG TPA: CbtB domain-containing protein [Rhodocyclaceae bacterium]|nr:CbtB domain-containing protein [Rhodocyclaceae bacterium]
MQALVLNPSTARRRTIPAVLQIAAAALLGLVMVYAAGFSTSAIAHNAAHDGRHSHAFPCH